MKICNKCGIEKPLVDYHIRSNNGKHQNTCKVCLNKQNVLRVSEHRRALKAKLVEFFGSKCYDCSYEGPPFMFDFDHRNPTEKEFTISGSLRIKWQDLLNEASKCDLVCSNCHRMRTHKQRCNGCKYCS